MAGKGGTGKTTLGSLLARYLVNHKKKQPILAVDADPNANFNEALGLEIEETVTEILTSVKDPQAVPTGMTKDVFVEYRISQAIVETDQLDLLVMGNPQGPGCYCFPMDLMRKYMDKLSGNYSYLVVDNEAGMEHLSRKILPAMDYLLVTSDATARGVRSAGRIKEIVETVGIEVDQMYLVITRGRENDEDTLREEIEKTGIELLGNIPYDEQVAEYDVQDKPLTGLPSDSPASVAVEKLVQSLNL